MGGWGGAGERRPGQRAAWRGNLRRAGFSESKTRHVAAKQAELLTAVQKAPRSIWAAEPGARPAAPLQRLPCQRLAGPPGLQLVPLLLQQLYLLPSQGQAARGARQPLQEGGTGGQACEHTLCAQRHMGRSQRQRRNREACRSAMRRAIHCHVRPAGSGTCRMHQQRACSAHLGNGGGSVLAARERLLGGNQAAGVIRRGQWGVGAVCGCGVVW